MNTYSGTTATTKENKLCMQCLFQLLIVHIFFRISSTILDAQIFCFVQVFNSTPTVSLLELSMLRLILQLAGIYTVLFYQTKIKAGKNETNLTKENLVSSTPRLPPSPHTFLQEESEKLSMLVKRGGLAKKAVVYFFRGWGG